jgi:hypothetical protein
MNNNKNKYIYFVLFFCFACSEKKSIKSILDKVLTFQVDKNFFRSLQETCEKENINLAINMKNIPNNIHGNFYQLPLKTILKICLNKEDFQIENIDNFIILKDQKEILKIYHIYNFLNDNQKKSITTFLQSFSENIGSKIVINEEDGYIIVNTFEKNHKIIKEYIDNINSKYNKQIYLECKIITIENFEENNKNLNLIPFFKGMLTEIFLSFNFHVLIKVLIKNLFLFNEIDDVVKFLSKIYKTKNIHNIQVLVMNKQPCIFQTEEVRYTSNYYDTKIIETNSSINDEDILTKNSAKNKKYKLNVQNSISPPQIVKNLKFFTSGISLKITPFIREKDIVLNIEYEQSNFQENKKNNELPNIIRNNFISSIKIKFQEICMINGLKNIYSYKQIKNKSKWKILNFLFAQEVTVNKEMQIIFLIKIIEK